MTGAYKIAFLCWHHQMPWRNLCTQQMCLSLLLVSLWAENVEQNCGWYMNGLYENHFAHWPRFASYSEILYLHVFIYALLLSYFSIWSHNTVKHKLLFILQNFVNMHPSIKSTYIINPHYIYWTIIKLYFLDHIQLNYHHIQKLCQQTYHALTIYHLLYVVHTGRIHVLIMGLIQAVCIRPLPIACIRPLQSCNRPVQNCIRPVQSSMRNPLKSSPFYDVYLFYPNKMFKKYKIYHV